MPSSINLNQMALPNLSTISQYPALTVGLAIFTFFLLIIDLSTNYSLSQKFSLYPYAPFKFDLNRLSFYLLFHQGFIHWLLNIIGLFTPLAMFERTHGTVYTGITLNLLTVTAGLQFSVVGTIFYPNTHVIGLSGVVFSFLSYVAYKEHQFNPVLYTFKYQGREYSIPTIYSPLVFLIICSVLLPGSSFWGHLAGISSGYLLALDYLKILYPPSKVILFIEAKLATAIKKLDGIVTYYKESDAIDIRGVSYNPILSQDIESMAGNSATSSNFRGEGNILGA